MGAVAGAPGILICDLDGTLVDSRTDLAASVNAARAELGLPALSIPAVVGMVGDGIDALLDRACPETAGDPQQRARAAAAFHAHYAVHCADTTIAYPGIAALLKDCRAQGLGVAVVTNKARAYSLRILAHCDLLPFIAVVVGGDDAPRKPDPGGIRLALERLAAAPGAAPRPATAAWMLGDHHTDLIAGRAAGLRVCHAAWGFGRRDGHDVDAIATTPEAVASCIGVRGRPPPPRAAEPGAVPLIRDADGAIITPELVLAAYRQRCFPMADDRDGRIAWYRPPLRSVITWDCFRVPESLAKRARRRPYRITADLAFRAVIAACAARQTTWISRDVEALYGALHDQGRAHSLEAWNERGELVGGLYGLCIGGCFCGESMFHRADDAAKLCVVALVERLQAQGFALLDCQQQTPHMERFGATEITDRAFAAHLAHCAAACDFGPAGEIVAIGEAPISATS